MLKKVAFFETFTMASRAPGINIFHQESVPRCKIGNTHTLFWIFEYITNWPFAGPLSADFEIF